MVNGKKEPGVWFLAIRQTEITNKEDRDKLSPTELCAWALLTCLKKQEGSRMSERVEYSILGWWDGLCLPRLDSVIL